MPMAEALFQVTGAFAEFERSMIRQRIKAGLKRAVAQGPDSDGIGFQACVGHEV
jgi:DNA invertase Pin-like site-specific DNA recombinase